MFETFRLDIKGCMTKKNILSTSFRILLLIFSFAFISKGAVAQLNSDFKVDTVSGCAPAVIRFHDLTTGNPTSWFWDLGNGITSTQQNPNTLYFEAGKYTIKLIVKKGNITDTIVREDYITIYSPPVVNFSFSDSTGCLPLTVNFTDMSDPVSGSIVSREWDFGDGTFSNLNYISHDYNVAGNFTVALQVKNSFGCTSIKSVQSLIKVEETIYADFGIVGSSNCKLPSLIQFKDSSIGKNISSYEWNFGDGSTSNLKTPTHSYLTKGSYDVSLAVTNSFGCRDTIIKPGFINLNELKALFTGPDSVCQNTAVAFKNLSDPVAAKALWSFGDGTKSSLLNPSKSFLKTGTFSVKLITEYQGCLDSVSRLIEVIPTPSSKFISNSILSRCIIPLNVKFENETTGNYKYLWNFGDNQTDSISNPTHTYNQAGLFNVSLAVTDNNGCTSKTVLNNYVYIGPPTIRNLIGAPFQGCAPYTAELSANINAPEQITGYLWDFGDGTTSTLATPNHTYNDTGAYEITLKITTVNGCQVSFSLPRAIVLSTRPAAAFNARPNQACAFENVNFFDSSIGTITNWKWDFGDGQTSFDQFPNHSYTDTGYFPVTLIVGNNSCSDTLIIENYIFIKPPVAKFISTTECSSSDAVKFTDKSIGPEQWIWNFGDGQMDTTRNPIHKYAQSGNYSVTLEVINDQCKDKSTQQLTVVKLDPRLTVSDTSLCKHMPTKFVVSNIDASLVTSYNWSFGDGKYAVTNTPFITYTYTTSGKFYPVLSITNLKGCIDTVVKPIVVNVNGPTANFLLPKSICANSPVIFKDLSTTSIQFPITKWEWDFGDVKTDTISSPVFTHTYNTKGVYNVKLSIYDTLGCSDTLLKPAAILVTSPSASFTLADSLNCVGTNIKLTNNSSGIRLKYQWDLGDGAISTSRNLIYSYKQEGNFNVKLLVTDSIGCTDSLVKINAVKVANVVADMVISDSAGSCPPFIMKLWNKSKNYSSILWDFGEGSFSKLENPSHFFIQPGQYKIKLIANGYGSCKDSSVRIINVKGPSGKLFYSGDLLCSPGVTLFRASSKNRASFIYDFGDGSTISTYDSIVQHTYINTGKYKPKLLLSDLAGCQVPIIGQDTITIARVEANIKTLSTVYCDSTSVQFFDSSFVFNDDIAKLVWSFGDGKKDSLNQSPIHFYAAPGNYNVALKAVSKNGCIDTTSLDVPFKIVQSPEINILGNNEVCVNDGIQFKGNFLAADTSIIKWKWNFGDGDTALVQNPSTQYFSQAGNYKISAIATNSSNCTSVYNFPLQVNPLPTVFAGVDTTICIGQAVNLRPAGAATYRWNAHSTLSCSNCVSPLAKPLNFTYYVVEGTSQYGCKNKDTVTIKTISPFKLNISPNDTLCLGETINLFAAGSDKFSWTPGTGLNNPLQQNPVAKPLTTTTYQVIATDSQYCFADTGFVRITVYPNPVFNIVDENINLSVGQFTPVKTTSSPDINHWRWLPYLGLNCNNCPQPIASPKITTTYKAQAWNDGGCITEDEVTITVICNNTNIYIPNTFSPNNDGMNDVFYPRGKGIASVKLLTIFNRWGAVVYQRNNFNINDAQAGWNGTFNGVTLSPDVYVYKMDIVCENNEIFSLKGNITLIK